MIIAEAHRIDVILEAIDKASSPLNRITGGFNVLTKAGFAAGVTFAITNKIFQLAEQGISQIGTAIMDSIDAFRRWEVETTKINSLLSETEKSLLPKIKDSLEGMSLIFGESVDKLAEGYTTLQKKGYDAVDSQKLLYAATKLNVATWGDEEATVKAVADIMGTYNMSTSQADYATGLLYEVTTKTRVGLDDFAQIVERLAPLAEAYGISIEDVASAMTILSDKGYNTRMMMSALPNLIEQITTPSEEQKKTMYGLGIAYDDLILRATGVHGILEKIKTAAGNDTEALKQLVGGTQELNIALALTSGTQFEDTISSFKTGFADMTAAYDDAMTTQQKQSELTDQKMEELKRSTGDWWGDRLQDFKNIGNDILNIYSELETNSKEDIYGIDIESRVEKYNRLMKEAQDAVVTPDANTEAIDSYANALQKVSNYIIDQVSLVEQLTSRQTLYNEQLTQMKGQRDTFIAVHNYTEALRYIPMALEDATYTTKIFDLSTRALVDSIHIQNDEIKRLTDANKMYSLSEEQNSLKTMQIQLAGMNQRHGLTRTQEKQLKELEKADLSLRISSEENQLKINQIHAYGLDSETENLNRIKMAYDEKIYSEQNAYQKSLDAMNLNIKGQKLLLGEYQSAIDTTNTNILAAQTEFWTEYNSIADVDRLNDLTKGGIYNDARVADAKKAQLAIIAIRKAETSQSVLTAAGIYSAPTLPKSPFDFMKWLLGGGIGKGLPSKQSGGYIPETAPYLLHKGETVIPANKSTAGSPRSMTINVNATIKNFTDLKNFGNLVGQAIAAGYLGNVTSEFSVG